MKKLTKHASRRKWILGGVLAFAGVTLLTVGTATWIVGQDSSSKDENIQVSVDSVENRSVVLTTSLSDSVIELKETEKPAEDGILGLEGEATPDALKITFSEIKLTYGNNYFNSDSDSLKFDFSIKYHDEEGSATNSQNLVKESKIGTKRVQAKTAASIKGASIDSWEYVAAPEPLTLSGSDGTGGTDSDSGLKTITYTNKTVEFRWGSFFDNSSPCTYYNGLTFDDELKAMNDITNELEAMQVLSKISLTISVSVVKGA